MWIVRLELDGSGVTDQWLGWDILADGNVEFMAWGYANATSLVTHVPAPRPLEFAHFSRSDRVFIYSSFPFFSFLSRVHTYCKSVRIR